MNLLSTSLVTDAHLMELPDEKKAAIRATVDSIAKSKGLNADDVFEGVMEREQVMSTGMGHGVAVPHCKMTGLDDFYVSISRSSKPIDYQSLDSTPVRILVLLLSPEDKTKEHVKMIAEITKRLKFSNVREAIIEAKTAKEMEEALTSPV
ncbi:MAG: PTS sugar transporter subunit IIA [Candidatus Lindowbacteria bacterium]|nr:PTS sugar transporter subunit IIA [Candidatus Lindowbacteria bacterium]